MAAGRRRSPGSTAEPGGAWRSELERCRRRRRRCRYCRRRCSLCISRSLPLPFLPSALPPRVRPPARSPTPPASRPPLLARLQQGVPSPARSVSAPLPGGPQLLSSCCSPCAPRCPVIQRHPPPSPHPHSHPHPLSVSFIQIPPLQPCAMPPPPPQQFLRVPPPIPLLHAPPSPPTRGGTVCGFFLLSLSHTHFI